MYLKKSSVRSSSQFNLTRVSHREVRSETPLLVAGEGVNAKQKDKGHFK